MCSEDGAPEDAPVFELESATASRTESRGHVVWVMYSMYSRGENLADNQTAAAFDSTGISTRYTAI